MPTLGRLRDDRRLRQPLRSGLSRLREDRRRQLRTGVPSREVAREHGPRVRPTLDHATKDSRSLRGARARPEPRQRDSRGRPHDGADAVAGGRQGRRGLPQHCAGGSGKYVKEYMLL